MRRLVTAIVVATVATSGLFALVAPAGAEPGDYDGAFGSCGLGVAQDTMAPSSETWPLAPLRQPSGRILQPVVHSGGVVVVFRFHSDGTPDPGFGVNGVADPGVVTAGREPAVFVTPTGRFYAIGMTGQSTIRIVAFTVDGQRDASFGDAGVVTYPYGDVIWGATVQGERFILARATNYLVHIERLALDGSVDPTFATIDPALVREMRSVTVGPDGGLVVDIVEPGGQTTRLVRFDADGHTLGPVVLDDTPIGANDNSQFRLLTLLHDGGFLLTRHVQSGTPYQSYLSRFLPSGAPDPSFGTGGRVTVSNSTNIVVTAAAELADHELVLLISDQHALGPTSVLYQVQFRTADGAVDATRTGASFNLSDGYTHLAGFDVAGSSVLVGFTVNEFKSYAGVLRYSLEPLRQGAGLMLQWNGDAWSTRFGTDPGPECPSNTPYWPDDDNARGITTVNGKGGYVVDLFGGIHRFSIGLQHPRPPTAVGGPYWPGWDITRGIASKPDGTGGYVLDAYGGVHPFHTGANPNPAATVNGPYWPGWDITRGIALMPDGARGYILDGFGGVHRFTTPGHAMPPALNHTAYWPGWDIARAIAVLPDGTGGYIVDAYGGAHPFGLGKHAPPPPPGPGAPYAPGEDWVRGYTFVAPMPAGAGSGVTGAARTTGSSGGRPATWRPPGPTPRGHA